MPRSFVEQALARCSADGSKLWFNCNPDVPEHWFRREWLLKLEQKDATHLHFTMEDNPGLSEETPAYSASVFWRSPVESASRLSQRYSLSTHTVSPALCPPGAADSPAVPGADRGAAILRVGRQGRPGRRSGASGEAAGPRAGRPALLCEHLPAQVAQRAGRCAGCR